MAGLAWAVWGHWLGAPFVSALGLLSAAAAVGFLTLNWPPARIFMGDAGSTVLGFLLAAAPLLAAVEGQLAFDHLLIAAALALWPFLVDGTFTLFRRLGRGENILQAHRSHLYQRLVIAGQTHRRVTLVYGALALVGRTGRGQPVASCALKVPAFRRAASLGATRNRQTPSFIPPVRHEGSARRRSGAGSGGLRGWEVG